jgi:SAM-dependent methyltransferase
MIRCTACNAFRSAEVPTSEQLERLYREDTIYHAPGDEAFRNAKARFIPLAAGMSQRPGDLLEVGCNSGYALEAFQDRGWNVTGCEQNIATARFAAKRLQRPILHSLSELRPEERFDVILLSHVLEHVVQPLDFLESLRAHFRPQGKVVILVPNYGSLFVRHLFRHSWGGYLPLQHVWYFDPRSLVRLMSFCGFEPTFLSTDGYMPYASRDLARSLAKAPLATLQRILPGQGDELVASFQLREALIHSPENPAKTAHAEEEAVTV